MKVLYLCNEYYGSQVHRNLCEGLARLGVSLQVYTYMSDPARAGLNAFESDRVRFYYRPVLKRWHRLFYHLKVRRVCADLMKTIDAQQVDLICATTMFTDGAVARRAARRLGVPYIVMARNTDVNTFLRYMPHTWLEGRRIAKGAARVVCISPQIELRISRAWQFRGTGVAHKCTVQANGIDDFWIDHSVRASAARSPQPAGHSLLYVGVFNRNKNVVRLCRSVLRLRRRYPDICLGLAGGGGSMHRRVARFAKRHPRHIRLHGRIADKAELQALYSRYALFAMPSIHETFGLVYLEALSQNLPVIYTRGQGIDGLFAPEVGEAVNALSGRQVRAAVARIFDHPERYRPSESVNLEQFRWSTIALRYKALFATAIDPCPPPQPLTPNL